MAVLIAMLLVSSTGSIATIPGWHEISGCEEAMPEVRHWYRMNGADVVVSCEILPSALPPPLFGPK